LFCTDHNAVIDYKQVDMLRRFITKKAKSGPAARPARAQNTNGELARAIKRARHLALVQYSGEALR